MRSDRGMLGALSRRALIIALVACGAPTEGGTLQAALDHQLSVNAQRHGIAGQAVLIVHDGKTIYRGSQGLANRETGEPVRPDHIFPVYSVAKLFANVLVMQLVERGELDLDQPASRYLPGLPERWRTIKVAEFLNHVSGVPDYFDGNASLHPFPPTRDAVFQALADKPMLFPTGASERYTQTNFLVIEAVLEAHYKQPYRQIVTERILQPLGMHDTFLGKSHVPPARLVRSYRGENDQLAPDVVIDWPEYSIVHTEVYTTIDDFGGFLEAVCAGRLVRRETLLRLWKPYRNATGGFGQFAAGWEYDRDPSYHHVGHDGGTKVRVRVLFDDSLSHNVYIVVYWTNGSAANVWSRKLVDSVMDIAPRYER